MRQDNFDISQIQVPNDFIQEIVGETQQIKESREEIYPQRVQAQTPEVSPLPENFEETVAALFTKLFESVDALQNSIDSISTKIDEMTTVGTMGTNPGYANTTPSKPKRKKTAVKETSLTALLRNR